MKMLTAKPQLLSGLRRRIRRFYDRLNGREFERCYNSIDPEIRASPTAVTLGQYIASAERFLAKCGKVTICELSLTHLNIHEPTRQYHERGFALLTVAWEDKRGQRHIFKERWVRDPRGWWFTRCTGFVIPE